MLGPSAGTLRCIECGQSGPVGGAGADSVFTMGSGVFFGAEATGPAAFVIAAHIRQLADLLQGCCVPAPDQPLADSTLSTRTRAGRPYSRTQSASTRITRALGIDVPISIARPALSIALVQHVEGPEATPGVEGLGQESSAQVSLSRAGASRG